MPLGQILTLNTNKTETYQCHGRARPAGGAESCCYVIADDGSRHGPRFCGAPAMPGSAYCRQHRALCAIDPGSAAGAGAISRLARAADRGASPPDELAYLASNATPELDCADEPSDLAACIDLWPAHERGDE